MDNPTFDETAVPRATLCKIVSMPAPFDSADKTFEGGRDAAPLPEDNALARFALGMPPAYCTANEYAELKAEAASIRLAMKALAERQLRLDNRIESVRFYAGVRQ